MRQISFSKYASICRCSYKNSRRHPWMQSSMRAAQFAPFAALSGHEEAIKKVCQYLEEQALPAEDDLQDIKRQLDYLKQADRQLISISFIDKDNPDKIIQLTEKVKRIDEYNQAIVMESKQKIPFNHILQLEIKSIGI